MNKANDAYKTIGEVVKILELKSNKKGILPTHTIRFWEKQFKQIKPYIFAGNRRYYDNGTIETLKKIQFLLKIEGMTIKGVRNQLQIKNSDLDEVNNKTINRRILKLKLDKISKIIKDIKNNG